jgi:hypothetical protein
MKAAISEVLGITGAGGSDGAVVFGGVGPARPAGDSVNVQSVRAVAHFR